MSHATFKSGLTQPQEAEICACELRSQSGIFITMVPQKNTGRKGTAKRTVPPMGLQCLPDCLPAPGCLAFMVACTATLVAATNMLRLMNRCLD
eukprot:1155264-Pelagomonas_calceolata.AAC.1